MEDDDVDGEKTVKKAAKRTEDFKSKGEVKIDEKSELRQLQPKREKLEGEKKYFRVELSNISSEEEGKELCSILSSRQFSCLLFNDLGGN